MKIGIFVGSMQADSNSAKVGRVIREQLEEQGHSSFVLDLGKTPLPLWGSAEAESEQSRAIKAHAQEFGREPLSRSEVPEDQGDDVSNQGGVKRTRSADLGEEEDSL